MDRAAPALPCLPKGSTHFYIIWPFAANVLINENKLMLASHFATALACLKVAFGWLDDGSHCVSGSISGLLVGNITSKTAQAY